VPAAAAPACDDSGTASVPWAAVGVAATVGGVALLAAGVAIGRVVERGLRSSRGAVRDPVAVLTGDHPDFLVTVDRVEQTFSVDRTGDGGFAAAPSPTAAALVASAVPAAPTPRTRPHPALANMDA